MNADSECCPLRVMGSQGGFTQTRTIVAFFFLGVTTWGKCGQVRGRPGSYRYGLRGPGQGSGFQRCQEGRPDGTPGQLQVGSGVAGGPRSGAHDEFQRVLSAHPERPVPLRPPGESLESVARAALPVWPPPPASAASAPPPSCALARWASLLVASSQDSSQYLSFCSLHYCPPKSPFFPASQDPLTSSVKPPPLPSSLPCT